MGRERTDGQRELNTTGGREHAANVHAAARRSASSPPCSASPSGLVIDWFPTQASEQAEHDRHALGRPDDLLRPGLRARHDGRPLLRLALPHAAGRGAQGRPADPRQHAARDHLDRDPGDHARRALLLRLRRADRHRGGRRAARSTCASSASSSPGPSTTATRRPSRSPRRSSTCRAASQVNFTVQSKDVIHDFWVPAFRMKIDAVPGLDTHLRVTPTEHRRLPRRLRGAVRARARRHAPDRARRRARRVRALARGARRAGSGGGRRRRRARPAAARRRRRQGDLRGHGLRRLPHARRRGHDRRHRARTSTRSSQGKDEAFIRESIVDPDAEIAQGFSPGIMPPNYGDTLQPAELDALVEYLAEVTR